MTPGRIKRVAAAFAALSVVALVSVIAAVNAQDPSPADLALRCRASQPAWNGYQEDVKEIGARPVARWHGEPVSLTVKDGEVRLTMALSPPWDAWEAALPVLLKDPEGRVVRNDSDQREGSLRVYVFNRPETAGDPKPPWLEIQFPHTKQRLYLDAEGTWRRASNPGG